MKKFIIHVDRHNKFNQIFIPLAYKFAETLKSVNAPIETVNTKESDKNIIKIIFGSHSNPEYWISNSNENDIIVNLEPVYKKKIRDKNNKYLELINNRITLEYCSLNYKFLNNYYHFYVPPFYVWPQNNNEKEIEKKFDVLFVGSTNESRKKNLQNLMNRNIKLVSGFKIFSKELNLAIKKSKIYLQLNEDESNIFNYFKFAHSSLYNIVYAGHSGNLVDGPEIKELLGLSLFENDNEMIDGIENLLNDEDTYTKAMLIQKKIANKYNNNFNLLIKKIVNKYK